MSDLIRDVMTREVITVRPETSFRDIVRVILEGRVHAVPVVDDAAHVVGMVAEGDLLIKEELSEGHRGIPLQRRLRARMVGTTAREIMTHPVITIFPSDTLGHAARVLHRRRIGRLPVVDQGRLVGIVARSDLLRVFLRSDEDLLAEVEAAIAAAREPQARLTATVVDGVVTLRGSAQFTSQVMSVADRVRRIPGIVALKVKATAVYDDVHASMVGP